MSIRSYRRLLSEADMLDPEWTPALCVRPDPDGRNNPLYKKERQARSLPLYDRSSMVSEG
ncbi:hypothetical protein [Longibacter salinarum]|uniref:hypothetical protein n=1 Tax=Longibacter salinarum TaxID=1850348 RepID=UPI0015CF4A85|nr:hypothetical protein [Longibacter salinarum]